MQAMPYRRPPLLCIFAVQKISRRWKTSQQSGMWENTTGRDGLIFFALRQKLD